MVLETFYAYASLCVFILFLHKWNHDILKVCNWLSANNTF